MIIAGDRSPRDLHSATLKVQPCRHAAGQTGNDVGARKLVEQVLAEDPSQVAALQMNALWQIEALE